MNQEPSQTQRLPILIVGSTGSLGSFITKHCLANSKLLVNILLPDPEGNQDLVKTIEGAGGKAFKGDITQPETLDEPTKGIHTVICAVHTSDEKVAVDGQLSLVEASVKNGVKRFVPSDFDMNYSKFKREEVAKHQDAEKKLAVHDQLKTASIKILSFWSGFLAESFFKHQKLGFSYWGEANHKLNITTMEDIAKVVAIAVSREDLEGKVVFIGNEVTIEEISDTYNKVRGVRKAPKRLGSLEFLHELHDMKKDKGDDSSNYEVLGFDTVLYDHRSTFTEHHNNEFSEVKPTSIEEFLKANKEITIGDMK